MLSTLQEDIEDQWMSQRIKFLIRITFVRCQVCSKQHDYQIAVIPVKNSGEFNVLVTPEKAHDEFNVSVTPGKAHDAVNVSVSPGNTHDEVKVSVTPKEMGTNIITILPRSELHAEEDKLSSNAKFDVVLLGLETKIVPLVDVTFIEGEDDEGNEDTASDENYGWKPLEFDMKIIRLEDIFNEEGMNLPMTPFTVINHSVYETYQLPEYDDENATESLMNSCKLSDAKIEKVTKIELADFSSIIERLKLGIDSGDEHSSV